MIRISAGPYHSLARLHQVLSLKQLSPLEIKIRELRRKREMARKEMYRYTEEHKAAWERCQRTNLHRHWRIFCSITNIALEWEIKVIHIEAELSKSLLQLAASPSKEQEHV